METSSEVITFTVVERRAISEDLTLAAQRWLTQRGLDEQVDDEWLELVCEDGDAFRPDNLMLHVAVPACEVSAGDSIEVGRTQTVAERWPEPGAPAGEVPRHLALARTIERVDDRWVGACELPGPVRELFTVERPDAMLAVMTATRRTLNRGVMSITGDPAGTLLFTVVEGDAAAWGSIEAEVPEVFTCWLDARPAVGLAGPLRDSTRVVGGLGALSDLILTNERGGEARCPLEEDGPVPVPLAPEHFESNAQGPVERLRIDRAGGLGRDALAAIAKLQPGAVAFTVAGDGSLRIDAGVDGTGGDSAGDSDGETFELAGPGFTAADSAPIVVPYVVALSLYDGAAAAPVELTVDDRWGRLHRADHGITVEWRR
jgi:hypothetical protein